VRAGDAGQDSSNGPDKLSHACLRAATEAATQASVAEYFAWVLGGGRNDRDKQEMRQWESACSLALSDYEMQGGLPQDPGGVAGSPPFATTGGKQERRHA